MLTALHCEWIIYKKKPLPLSLYITGTLLMLGQQRYPNACTLCTSQRLECYENTHTKNTYPYITHRYPKRLGNFNMK